MTARRPGVSIYTAPRLRAQARHLDRLNQGVGRTIAAMRAGAALHLTQRPVRKIWVLSSGQFVTDEVARAVIARPEVAQVGDVLFVDALSQTYRFVES